MKTMAKTLGSEGNKERMNQSWVQLINTQLAVKIHVPEKDRYQVKNKHFKKLSFQSISNQIGVQYSTSVLVNNKKPQFAIYTLMISSTLVIVKFMS